MNRKKLKKLVIWFFFHILVPFCKWADKHQEFIGSLTFEIIKWLFGLK